MSEKSREVFPHGFPVVVVAIRYASRRTRPDDDLNRYNIIYSPRLLRLREGDYDDDDDDGNDNNNNNIIIMVAVVCYRTI